VLWRSKDNQTLECPVKTVLVYDSMKALVILIAALVSVFAAEAQTLQCLRTDFSGEARQAKPFSQNLGGGVTFSVNPMQLREDPKQAWFVIHVIGDDATGFVLQPSDMNWVLAASGFWTAFIGGNAGIDVRASLGYRSRHLLLPLSNEDMRKAREAAHLVYDATTPEQERGAIAALTAVRLAQADFEITDYGFGAGDPPVSVEWVRFNVTLTLPLDFAIWGTLPVSVVDCPAIPAETIANLREPRRHEYLLPRKEQSRQQE
jgi:hypothetical protein